MYKFSRQRVQGKPLADCSMFKFGFLVQSLTSVAQGSSPVLVASASEKVGAAMATTTAGTGPTKPTAQVTE